MQVLDFRITNNCSLKFISLIVFHHLHYIVFHFVYWPEIEDTLHKHTQTHVNKISNQACNNVIFDDISCKIKIGKKL